MCKTRISCTSCTHLDRVHWRPEADHAQVVVYRALHLVPALLTHSPRQPLPRRVLGLGRHRGDARGFVLFPVAALAGFAAVVGDLALRALTQRRAPALLLAEEAAEQVDPQHGFGALLLGFAELLLALLVRLLVMCVRSGCGVGVAG